MSATTKLWITTGVLVLVCGGLVWIAGDCGRGGWPSAYATAGEAAGLIAAVVAGVWVWAAQERIAWQDREAREDESRMRWEDEDRKARLRQTTIDNLFKALEVHSRLWSLHRQRELLLSVPAEGRDNNWKILWRQMNDEHNAMFGEVTHARLLCSLLGRESAKLVAGEQTPHGIQTVEEVREKSSYQLTLMNAIGLDLFEALQLTPKEEWQWEKPEFGTEPDATGRAK